MEGVLEVQQRLENIQNVINDEQLQIQKVPGDGLCLFYCLAHVWRRAPIDNRVVAQQLFLEALELAARQAPEDVFLASAMVPETEAELQKHLGVVHQRGWKQNADMDNPINVVIASKALALMQDNNVLDSWHYGGAVEGALLARHYAADVLYWGLQENENYWGSTMEMLTDREAADKLQQCPGTIQLLFYGLHFDLLQTQKQQSAAKAMPADATLTWNQLFAQGDLAILESQVQRACNLEWARQSQQPNPFGPAAAAATDPNKQDKNIEKGTEETPPQRKPRKRPRMETLGDEADGERSGPTGRDCNACHSDSNEESETISESSEEEEMGPLQVETNKSWITREDRTLQRLDALKTLLREAPLLPPSLPNQRQTMLDPMSGVKWPIAHCSFKGCSWTSESVPCEQWRLEPGEYYLDQAHWRTGGQLTTQSCCRDAKCLWQHLLSAHSATLEHVTGQACPRAWLDSYAAAIEGIEQQRVPTVGWSVDRRTLCRLAHRLEEETTLGLICACCARVGRSGWSGDTGFLPAKELFDRMSLQRFQQGWSLTTYCERYAHDRPGLQNLVLDSQWVRQCLDGKFKNQKVLLCPEDIQCTQRHLPNGLCDQCQMPLCQRCLGDITHGFSPAASLASDNLWGYGLPWIYKYGVRYIESVAACPLFTALVSYYVEADGGHMLEEQLHQASHPVRVRGNVSSFPMPWEEIYGSMAAAFQQDPSEMLPHAPETLARLVQFHLHIGNGVEMSKWLPGTRLRPFVVMKLLEHLLETRHPWLEGVDKEDLRRKFQTRLEKLYPETEADLPYAQRDGQTPPAVEAAIKTALKKAKDTQVMTELHEKHATPGAGNTMPAQCHEADSKAVDGWGEHCRPEVVSGNGTAEAAVDVRELLAFAQRSQSLFAKTGTQLVDQWNGEYIFAAFPFSLPEVVSGADWPLKPRKRRHKDAPELTPMAFARLLAGRVEGCTKNSWDLVPAMRRIATKWLGITGRELRIYRPSNLLQPAALHAAELIEAAQGLYRRLEKGKWWDGRTWRSVNRDVSKLAQIPTLSENEKKLVQSLRTRQSVIPGSREVRKLAGHCLFGMRVEYGEPVFVTISPTLRHNALLLRFVRYREDDPARQNLQTRCHSLREPSLWDTETTEIHLPNHRLRKELAARDPWASVLSFQHAVRCVLGQIAGVRWCSKCPACSCQNTFGSSSEIMGGAVGCCTAIAGAVEYQRNSAPHFHGNMHLRNCWQWPLAEIAKAIENRLLQPSALLEFYQWLHREEHYNLEQHLDSEATLEKDWFDNFAPQPYDKLCLLPAFVKADTRASAWAQDAQMQPNPDNPDADEEEGEQYKKKYSTEAQFVWSRVQHHIHKTDPATGAKLPLRACAAKKKPTECKHGFPFSKKVGRWPRIVCPGNAQKFDLRCSGRRNALGNIVGKRNHPWLSGTLGALSLVLRSNSHTGPTYRMPLLPSTHDPACRRKCVQKTNIGKMQRAMSRAGHRTMGYFCGYIQKGQPVGKEELQKAGKQLEFLKGQIAGQDLDKQFYRVANRLLSDLEFRGTIRPTTEEFQLAGMYDERDLCAAEFLTTVATTPFRGGQLLQRKSLAKLPTHSKATGLDIMDLYPVRGSHKDVYWLSPWEFIKWWQLEPVKRPDQYETVQKALTDWLDKAQRTYQLKTVSPVDDVLFLPLCEETADVREKVVLRRRLRPLVPRPVGCPMPQAGTSKEEQCRILNFYLRPWIGVRALASRHVPFVDNLNQLLSYPKRLRGKQTVTPPSHTHANAWADYVQGHIVSKHAKHCIQGFLAAIDGKLHHVEPDDDSQKSKPSWEVNTSWVLLPDVHQMIYGGGASKKAQAAATTAGQFWEDIATEPGVAPLQNQPLECQKDGSVVEEDWQDPNVPVESHAQPQEHEATVYKLRYSNLTRTRAATWLQNLTASCKPPTQEQHVFLQKIIDRCLREQFEEQNATGIRSEPERILFHGVPGAGKSQCYHWVRSFFEEICGFQHGREFVFLAPQNTQAALIGGYTIHSFGNIDRHGYSKSGRGEDGMNKWYIQYQNLRWIFVDEVSCAGLEVLGHLHQHLVGATRDRDTWKLRLEHGQEVPRLCAGMNVIWGGDFWQFPAVKATSIVTEPGKSATALVRKMQDFFWTRGWDSVTYFHELTKEQRCVDPWLSYFLDGARYGRQLEEVWAFAHGLPTRHPGSWNFRTQKVDCGQAPCALLTEQWAHDLRQPGEPTAWKARRCQECRHCSRERQRRCIVIASSDLSPSMQQHKFIRAPFIHALNAAKYTATQVRAKHFAKAEQRICLWVIAKDQPLWENCLPPEISTQKLWLQKHDQETGGVSGLLPLIKGMPLRISVAVPELRQWNLYKNSRVTLEGWCLSTTDAARLQVTTQQELVLLHLPRFLVVATPGPAARHVKVKPTTVTWTADKAGNARISRCGLPVAADFSGTAHSFAGATLDAATVDVGNYGDRPNKNMQLIGYMSISRVRRIEDVAVVQPYPPALFRQGDLDGPRLLVDYQRRRIDEAAVKAGFAANTKTGRSQPWPAGLQLCCRGCSDKQKTQSEVYHPLGQFEQGLENPAKIIFQGMERFCRRCATSRIHHPESKPAAQACSYCGAPAKQACCPKCALISLTCQNCAKAGRTAKLPLEKFDPTQVSQWRKNKNLTTRAVCRSCLQAREAQQKLPELYECHGLCRKKLSVKHFPAAVLRAHLAGAGDLLCHACGNASATNAIKLPCDGCGVLVPARQLSPRTQLCSKCCLKKCLGCGTALPPSATQKMQYCLLCAYPPCACGKPRPQNGKYHRRSKPIWTCQECSKKLQKKL